MQKPNDNITVGIVTLPYSVILGGWLMPDGTVIKTQSPRKTPLSA